MVVWYHNGVVARKGNAKQPNAARETMAQQPPSKVFSADASLCFLKLAQLHCRHRLSVCPRVRVHLIYT